MKNAKRLVSLLVAVLMIAAIGVSALASGTPTYQIIVENSLAGQNFKAVKVFNLTYDDTVTPIAASYTIASPWAEFFKKDAPGEEFLSATNTGNALNPIVVEKSLLTGVATDTELVTAYINITQSNAARFAEMARNFVESNSSLTFTTVNKASDATAATEPANTTITVPSAGYWMVYETSQDLYPVNGAATTVILTSTTPSQSIEIKGEPDTGIPVKIPAADSIVDEFGTKIGDTIPYEVHSILASSEGHKWHYQVFTDTMTEGLTFNRPVTIKVGSHTLTIGDATSSQIRLVTTDAAMNDKTQHGVFGAIKYNDNGFKLILNTKAMNDSTSPSFASGAKILLTYTATVNSEAADLENNTLTYGNGGSYDDPFEPGTDIPQEPADSSTTWVNSVTVNKVIGNTTDPLEGVGFKLVRKSVKGLKILTATPYYNSLSAPLTSQGNLPVGDTVYQIVGKGKIVDASNNVTEYYKVKNGNTEVYIPVDPAANYQMAEFTLAQEEFCKLTFDNSTPPKVTKVEWVTAAAQGTELFTDANGELTFPGLEDGTYYLRETTTPAGYNGLTGDVEVVLNHTVSGTTIVPANETETISNNKGGLLPNTGGIGTTIFYVLGGILLIGASVLLVTRRRMSAVNN